MSVRYWLLLTALAVAAQGSCQTFGADGLPDGLPLTKSEPPWNENQIKAIAALWIGSLPPLPADPSNRYAADPRAAELGRRIFFDTRFSSNGRVACASCHQPDKVFSDNKIFAAGVGPTGSHTMSLVGAAYSPWLFWDGRADSLWRQALDPLEHPHEHGGNRTYYAHVLATHYREPYQAIFGELPDMQDTGRFPQHAGPKGSTAERSAWEYMRAADRKAVNRIFANIGKVLAAYERRLIPAPARFDAYAEAIIEQRWETAGKLMTSTEIAGLALFIGKGNCTHCHNGALFTNNEFHNIGLVLKAERSAGQGRIRGVQQALASEFNCLGEYSDARVADCAELNFVKTAGLELQGAFRAPSLRNVAGTAPYMHTGQFATLREVLEHYRQAPFTFNGKTELLPIDLTDEELQQLEAFLLTLSSPPAIGANWLQAADERQAD